MDTTLFELDQASFGDKDCTRYYPILSTGGLTLQSIMDLDGLEHT